MTSRLQNVRALFPSKQVLVQSPDCAQNTGHLQGQAKDDENGPTIVV